MGGSGRFEVVETSFPPSTTRAPMFTLSVFDQILKQIPRRQFQTLVEKRGADKWVKSFTCWQQLVAMMFAQMSAQTSLRDVVATFNGQPVRHYHLGAKALARSTLADANATRPVAVFEDLLNLLLAKLTKREANEARAAVRLLDSTVISLSHKLHRWAAFSSPAPSRTICSTKSKSAAIRPRRSLPTTWFASKVSAA